MRAPRVLVPLLALALVVAGCSSDDVAGDRSPAAKETTTTATGTDTGAEPTDDAAVGGADVEVYDGDLEGFYEVPDPLPAGEPGDLIRVQDLGTEGGRTTLRVMYRSTDSVENDRAVTGTISYPADAEAPEGGWPVVSTAHGTTGVSTICAPSRAPLPPQGWGVEGVWAMSDYIGLGPIGERHAYLGKADEGNAVIDIVRAARQLPDANAGTRWLSVGHSQGGHGALAAHELAAERAPELELVATVALAPAAMLDKVYDGIDPIVTGILMMMALWGGSYEQPEAFDPARYLTPGALEATSIFETGCLAAITEALIPVAFDGIFIADPRQTEPARAIVLANDVGEVAVDGVPLYVASGTKDDRVVEARVRDLFTRLCDAGQVTEFTIVDDATHDSILDASEEPVATFLNNALDGGEPTDSCADPAATAGD